MNNYKKKHIMAQRQAVTYERVEGRIGRHPAHLVDGLKGEDVLVVVGAPQGAASTAAGAQVTWRESCWSSCVKDDTHRNKIRGFNQKKQS